MKVLWFSSQAIPSVLKEIEPEGKLVRCGWMQGAADEVLRHDDIELSFCFQYSREIEGKTGKMAFYTMPEAPLVRRKDIVHYASKDFERFKTVIDKVRPDVIQVFGTESWFQRQIVEMAYDLGVIDHTVVWIQGLVYRCGDCYADGLSIPSIQRKTFWEMLRGTNVKGISDRLLLNGEGEIRVLKKTRHVFVRTAWDSACCKAVNPNVNLHFCNESLRDEFYSGERWNADRMQKHSIFISQHTSPLKGFHKVLEALPIILQEFPDTMVYTTGSSPLVRPAGIWGKIREASYIRLLRETIQKNNLSEHICFLGMLDGEEMKAAYLKSNVFLSSSSIENSPNSVGEAMILGVPVVASDVGGVGSVMTHEVEGYLYPFHEVELMAEYIMRVFRDKDLAQSFSFAGIKRAKSTHNKIDNYNTLVNCYREIAEN